ncbi:MAG: hypothetical protein WCJ04_10890 [Actinomycetes bacterium]
MTDTSNELTLDYVRSLVAGVLSMGQPLGDLSVSGVRAQPTRGSRFLIYGVIDELVAFGIGAGKRRNP